LGLANTWVSEGNIMDLRRWAIWASLPTPVWIVDPPTLHSQQDPIAFADSSQRVDLTKFPPLPGSHRSSSGSIWFGFSIAASETVTEPAVMNYLDHLLVRGGCQADRLSKKEAVRIYHHGDLVLVASCGTTRGKEGPDINAGG
jgi:hypothetical protein